MQPTRIVCSVSQALIGVWLAFAATLAQAEISEALSYRYYAGANEPGVPLFESLVRATPVRIAGRPFLGHTAWHITWDLRWRRGNDGRCTLERIRTHLKATITLPQKAPDDSRAAAAFPRFVNALREHEMGHVDIARETARAIDDRIWQLPTMPNCGALEMAANNLGQRLLHEARQQGLDFDRRTGHGRSTGVVLTE
ncbi:hypothetical protein LPB72_09620 [Hydrogenophaga crassostreae]|uniref:Peptidase n=1 Tax=Hydrogenophaga crassostreae TaxID=1763535 RepID=A0A162P5N7_9BURK|nr:DUF922 domain-containing protein [Hydrogenophaga crassostreae]AOW13303.1 hypothetical protein LPB072_11005 [Hydrogenophaga crassostreae]OAD41584.1 hypothetical protein LPB72_09620 [Hydrogenophaga crassostreae]